jgi:hypothetical protein
LELSASVGFIHKELRLYCFILTSSSLQFSPLYSLFHLYGILYIYIYIHIYIYSVVFLLTHSSFSFYLWGPLVVLFVLKNLFKLNLFPILLNFWDCALIYRIYVTMLVYCHYIFVFFFEVPYWWIKQQISEGYDYAVWCCVYQTL